MSKTRHASDHENGGSDEIDVTGLTGAGGAPAFHGVVIYHNANQAMATAAETALLMNSEEYDTDAYHFTSDANLTGTIAKSAASNAIVGTGTAFTTELSVGQIIRIPGTATEYGVVSAITNNTNLTVFRNMVNTATGQTGVRVSGGISIPTTALAGYYDFSLNGQVDTARSTYMSFRKNPVSTASIGTLIGLASDVTDTSQARWINGVVLGVPMVQGDFVIAFGLTTTGNNLVANGTRLPSMTARLVGT